MATRTLINTTAKFCSDRVEQWLSLYDSVKIFNRSERMDERLKAIEREIPALRRYAWTLLKDKDAAEELVHDCIVKATANRESWQPTGTFRGWLFTILHNLYANKMRASSRQPVKVALEEIVQPPQAANQVESVELREVLRLLDQLKPEYKEVILLVAVEGATYAEAATILDVPIGTLMSRLYRARAQLRKGLWNEPANGD